MLLSPPAGRIISVRWAPRTDRPSSWSRPAARLWRCCASTGPAPWTPPTPTAPTAMRAAPRRGLSSLVSGGHDEHRHIGAVQKLVRYRTEDGTHDGPLTAAAHHDDPGTALGGRFGQ